MASDRTERYRIEIDINNALSNYQALLDLSNLWEASFTRVERASQNLKAALNRLAASQSGDAARQKQARQEVIKVGKEYVAALREQQVIEKALSKESLKREKLSRITLKAKRTLAKEEEAQSRKQLQLERVTRQAKEAAIKAEEDAIRKKSAVEQKASRQTNKALSLELKAREKNGREFLRQLKSYPVLRAELSKLVQAEGTLTAAFDRNGKAANDDAKKLLEIADSSRILRGELKRLAGETGGISTRVSPADARSPAEQLGLTAFQVRQLGTAFDRLGIRGAGAVSNVISAFSGMSPAMIAATGGAIGITFAIVKLTQAVIKLGVEAAKAFSQIIKDSVEIAAKFDSVEKSFIGVFEGNAGAALVVLKRIREESIRLGTDIEEIVRKALPLVSSVEEAVGIGALAVGLGQLDPRLGEQGAVRAIQAGLVGNLEPLRKSFDIDVGPIVEAQKALGDVQGLIVGLGEVLEARGLDFETLAETFNVQVGSMQKRWKDFKLVIGDPIVEELTEQLGTLGDSFAESKDDLDIIANAIGNTIASIAESIGGALSSALEGFDEEKALAISEHINSIGSSITFLGSTITGGEFSSAAETLIGVLRDIDNVLFNITFHLAIAREGLATTFALDPLGPDWLDLLPPGIQQIVRLATSGEEALTEMADGAGRLGNMLLDRDKQMKALRQETEKFQATQGESAKLFRVQANEMLRLGLVADTVAEGLAKLTEEQQKLTEGTEDANKALDRAFTDAALKATQALIDAERKLSQDRVEAEKKFQDDIEKVRLKGRRKQEDNLTASLRKETDLWLKHRDRLLDIDKKSSDKRIDIEEKFQDKLAKIRRKADFDVTEAIRNNDAVAIERIRRRMEFQLNEEKIGRDKRIEDEGKDAEDRRQQADTARERELRDASLAHIRRETDRKLAFEREREDAKKQLDQRLLDLEVEHKRRRKEIALTLERERLSIQTSYDRRLADLQEHVDDQTKIYNDAVAERERLELESIARIAIARQKAARAFALTGPLGGFGSAPDALPGAGGGVPLDPRGGTGRSGGSGSSSDREDEKRGNRKARGGRVLPNEPVIIGDPDPARPNQPNPELYIPSHHGMVIPTSRLMFSPPSAGGATSNIFHNERNVEIGSVGSEVGDLSPTQERRVRNIMVEVLQEALGG